MCVNEKVQKVRMTQNIFKRGRQDLQLIALLGIESCWSALV